MTRSEILEVKKRPIVTLRLLSRQSLFTRTRLLGAKIGQTKLQALNEHSSEARIFPLTPALWLWRGKKSRRDSQRGLFGTARFGG